MENISDSPIDAAEKDPEEEGKPSLHYWRSQLQAYDNAADGWKKDVDAAFDEYLNEQGKARGERNSKVTTHLPLFWSCVRTIQPALYSRTPVIVTEKSFKEMQDPVARLAAVMAERLGKYLVKTSGFDRTMALAVTHFIMSEKITNRVIFDSAVSDVHVPYEDGGQMMMNIEQRLDYIKCETEPWHYRDGRHTPNARHQGEIDWMSFDTLLTRTEVEETFGEDAATELTFSPMGNGKDKDRSKEIKGLPAHFATITEIWDKKKRKVYYLSPGYSEWLKHENNPDGGDPYKLKDFFPCAPFMLGTFGAEDMFTRPAYVQLSDLIDQVHGAFDRLRRQILALKKVGVFDASKPELAELNAIAAEGQFIGVADLDTLLGPNGTLDKLIHFFPTDQIAKGVTELKAVIADFKNEFFDLWGIPDIYRGITDPNETLGAQQLKGKHMSVRFSVLQREVQRLARDTIEIMCDLYLQKCPEIKLAEIMGYKFMNQQTEAPLFVQALQLLKNDEERCVRLEIETDSTINMDIESEVEHKNNLAKTMFEGITALQHVPPAFMPVAAKAVELTVRAMREGKQVEDDLEQSMQSMLEASKAPPPPPPEDKSVQVAQIKAQSDQQKIQADMQQSQSDLQVKGQEIQLRFQELQLKAQELQVTMQLEREKMQVEMQKIAADNQIEAMKVQIDAQMKASEQALDGMRVQIEQYKAVLDEKEKFIEERRLNNEDRSDHRGHLVEAIASIAAKQDAKPQAMPVIHVHTGDGADGKPRKKKIRSVENDDGSFTHEEVYEDAGAE